MSVGRGPGKSGNIASNRVGNPAPPATNGRAVLGRVGRRRGGGCPLLIRRPLSERTGHLSMQDALPCRAAPARTGGSSTGVAVGSPPTSLRLSRRHLCPVALVQACPASLVGRDPHDDDEHSVTLARAGCRPSHGPSPVSVRGCGRWSPHPRDEARCRARAVRRGRRPHGQCPRTQHHRRRRSDPVSVTRRRWG